MRKAVVILGFVLLLTSCQKDSLENVNPNLVGLESLLTEDGFTQAAYGVYAPLQYRNGYFYIWLSTWAHNVMGDVTVSRTTSFGIRWANQTARIIRPSGQIVLPPVGGRQPEELDRRNIRTADNTNIQAFEWLSAYALIGHCNLLLDIIDEVDFSGDADIKKKTFAAWLHWWKGFAYSRLGSIYAQGLIMDAYLQQNPDYVSRTALIDEASRNFILAKDNLTTISDDNAAYNQIFGKLIPSPFKAGKGGVILPSMFIRNINTYMARNILVNKYAAELTAADYTAIENLASNGIRADDKIFNVRSASNNCMVYTTAWTPFRLNLSWEMISERLVQDFKPGDARFSRNIREKAWPEINPFGSGYQYGTRWNAASVSSGGAWQSTVAGDAEIYLAGSYEENQLMLAEIKIRRGEIEAGLAHIDEARVYQNAGLPATAGTGLTQVQALEELRMERRVGLFTSSVAFYDARRWGVLKPLGQGGGRQNALVIFSSTVIEACTIEYDYKEWWDVPANETDFNPISGNAMGSVDI